MIADNVDIGRPHQRALRKLATIWAIIECCFEVVFNTYDLKLIRVSSDARYAATW